LTHLNNYLIIHIHTNTSFKVFPNSTLFTTVKLIADKTKVMKGERRRGETLMYMLAWFDLLGSMSCSWC